MIAIFYLVLQILKLYSYVVIANVIVSWLIAFNVLNTQNRFVYAILELSYKLTEPFLNKIELSFFFDVDRLTWKSKGSFVFFNYLLDFNS